MRVHLVFAPIFGVHTLELSIIANREQRAIYLNEYCNLIAKGVIPQYAEIGEISEIILNQRRINDNQNKLEHCKYNISKIRKKE